MNAMKFSVHAGKGHNMPIIGGVDQKAGSKYRADAFERKDENTILISFAKAYDVSGVDTVLREISFEKENQVHLL